MRTKSQIFIITGDPQQGKTTFVMTLIEKLHQVGFTTGGFVAPGEFCDNRRCSFKLTDVKTGETKPLCKRDHDGSESNIPFTFFEEGQQFGRHLLRQENLKDCDFVFIDEIGPLELQGKGWAGSVMSLLECGFSKQIWVVRRSLVQQVIQKFGLVRAVVLDIESNTLEQAVELITLTE
jgi:nucleoside-triphosphatase